MTVAAQAAPEIDLVFDGRCGFCTRAALWLERVDRRSRVHLHPLQRPGVLEQFGLTEGEALAALWAFPRGATAHPHAARPYRGAAAVNLAADAAFDTRVFSALYRVPGVWWVQDRAYQWIADHRYLLRGVVPWCEQHTEDCWGRTAA